MVSLRQPSVLHPPTGWGMARVPDAVYRKAR